MGTKVKFYKGDWIITRDFINSKGDSFYRVGYSNRKEPEAKAKIKKRGKVFRMLDDDNAVHFHGKCLTDFGEEAFCPLDDLGRPDTGCTDIQYKNEKTGEWESL